MAILYALESSSGIQGTLVDAFGVYSNPAVSAFLQDVRFVDAGYVSGPGHEDGGARTYGSGVGPSGRLNG
jgi:hypothetical protein